MSFKVNSRRMSHITLAIPCVVLGLSSACSKSKTTTEAAAAVIETTGVEVSAADTVAISGTLAIPSFGLTATTPGVLAFKTLAGKVKGSPKELTVDADGKFTADISKKEAEADKLVTEAAKAPADRDWAGFTTAVNAVFGESLTEADLKAFPEDDIQAEIKKQAELESKTGSIVLLVQYEKSGDKIAEANSFHFIGLPTAGGRQMQAIPANALKGNLKLGKVSGDDKDGAAAELAANTDAFDLTAEALESYADAGKALKSLKNVYMNDDWSAEPFYVWNNKVSMAEATDKFPDVAELAYHGSGFYVGQQGNTSATFTYDQICATTPSVAVTFTPPSPVRELSYDGLTTSTVTAYDNSAMVNGTQGSNRTCGGGGMYIREDVRNGVTSFMTNFGTGGSILDTPAGLWSLKIGGTEVGRFDLESGSPMDANGKPIVWLASAKFVTVADKVTSVVIKFKKWNGTAYEDVTDLGPIKKLVSVMDASVSRISDNAEISTSGSGENRSEGPMIENPDGSATFVGTLSEPVALTDASSLSFYYKIGSASYRTEWRNR